MRPVRGARPFGQSVSGLRLVSMLMALVILWVLYERLKDPATWRVVLDEPKSQHESPAPTDHPVPEDIVEGPNDLDPDQVAEAETMLEAVVDRVPLKPREMPAYWRFMQWSRTQSLAELEHRAATDVPFSKLWDQPQKYRGQPIRLRLHVRRVLDYEATDNPLGLKNVYEAWGWTDNSLSFPYVVVIPEVPPSLPIGQDVRAEVVFTGYFLKIMSYTAFDHARGAPLLVGRLRLVETPASRVSTPPDFRLVAAVLTIAVLVIGLSAVYRVRRRSRARVTLLPSRLSEVPGDEFKIPDSVAPIETVVDLTEKSTTQNSSNDP